MYFDIDQLITICHDSFQAGPDLLLHYETERKKEVYELKLRG